MRKPLKGFHVGYGTHNVRVGVQGPALGLTPDGAPPELHLVASCLVLVVAEPGVDPQLELGLKDSQIAAEGKKREEVELRLGEAMKIVNSPMVRGIRGCLLKAWMRRARARTSRPPGKNKRSRRYLRSMKYLMSRIRRSSKNWRGSQNRVTATRQYPQVACFTSSVCKT